LVTAIVALGCCPEGSRSRQATRAGEEAPGFQASAPAATAPAASEPIVRRVEIQVAAAKGSPDEITARYETRYRDPVLEELRERDRDALAAESKQTGEIRKRQTAEKERKRLDQLELRSSLPAGQAPVSPADFHSVVHLPPVAQYYTGTCWSFAATSLLESEAQRMHGHTVKLSEMATVYYEYLDKAARVLRERGESHFGEGSQANALMRVVAERGAWPESAYAGVAGPDPRHDHIRLFRELEAVLDGLQSKDLWDEATGRSMLSALLDRHLGRPPERFEHQGRSMSPQEFLRDGLAVDPAAYVSFVSSLKAPFYTRMEFEVPDNWWHADSYLNLPLEEFYASLKGAIQQGFSLVIAVDVSEPGKDAPNDVMFVPDYDIPAGRIDQLARELRMVNGATTDDHGVHLVGWTEHAGHDWFLVKDSGRAALRGRHPGYFFVREDYVRLKVLAFLVHRDAVAQTLAKFPKP
jgi:bleomycin hydrolase